MNQYEPLPGNHTHWWDMLQPGDRITIHHAHNASGITSTITGPILNIHATYPDDDTTMKIIDLGIHGYCTSVHVPRTFDPTDLHITKLERRKDTH
ncbi:hypothetical protein [Bifidobacterium pseudolongum]|uniref:Uncharacterized protein n=1 Tax=Bifidobacterium pseudolongum subsp. globosum TaxID=1690 RepID=A0A4Q5AT25_9BIFI|nr:hypothetical protein [Bifidobacterium pseudolongum]RYQ36310.1 hypothetical protein PG2003B_1147 [Bifidobacterium pseudolongum subsp. globosum]